MSKDGERGKRLFEKKKGRRKEKNNFVALQAGKILPWQYPVRQGEKKKEKGKRSATSEKLKKKGRGIILYWKEGERRGDTATFPR